MQYLKEKKSSPLVFDMAINAKKINEYSPDDIKIVKKIFIEEKSKIIHETCLFLLIVTHSFKNDYHKKVMDVLTREDVKKINKYRKKIGKSIIKLPKKLSKNSQ